ncbi:hypothetical protein GCM10023321_77300 [Pseudonocardia eucalypti]|uniref:Thiocillin family RiPP n=1 Tax=Pseudonocardia eucalypti TaxID=648755 RepID=A0ABP9RBH8_9PSEU|nr:hypothetical protein [Pseudonocardia eucalypti]
MDNQLNLVDLVAGYQAYTSVDELNVAAAVDAPATSPVCAASVASSGWCAGAAGGAAAGISYHLGC